MTLQQAVNALKASKTPEAAINLFRSYYYTFRKDLPEDMAVQAALTKVVEVLDQAIDAIGE